MICPVDIFAINRNLRVRGRIKCLIVSTNPKKGVNPNGAPLGISLANR